MLLYLKIQNLALIESLEMKFEEGLNIITGETGAGKSTLLSAIRLMMGERADMGLVGQRGDLAVVEAALSHYHLPEGLEPPLEGPLLLRREIHRSGKSRSFAADQLISLATLREIVSSHFEWIGQSSSIKLYLPEKQREILDLFSETEGVKEAFCASFSREKTVEKELNSLLLEKEKRDLELSWAEKSLSLFEEAPWKEEEKLQEEHLLLSHSQELSQKVAEIESSLMDGQIPLFALLKRQAHLLESLMRFDSSLAPFAHSLKNVSLETEEIGSSLRTYLDRIETDPQKLAEVETKIQKIEQLKKRFGTTQEALLQKKEELSSLTERLSTLDQREALLKKELQELQGKNRSLANELSLKRKKGAKRLCETVLEELKGLNLPNSSFEIQICEKELSSTGIDEVSFVFSANLGAPLMPLEKSCSGGELSRLFLALKIASSKKEKISTFVFDEIDSNVGGFSASILGNKLLTLSEGKQVISVTHFVQVARSAMHHFLVYKSESKGTIRTQVMKLKDLEKEREYQRMVGKSL